ncbi:LGFP repeat-containing protein, partial [Cellulomonas sp. NPDC058312]|uniref:LGFP repeat-containing protein n=1 Tax=Cellulomonas sp. NPDC058312 TaxID=3346441 RepID=UPI0036EA006D
MFEVCGDILAKWNSLGGMSGKLGAPRSNENVLPDGRGRTTWFWGGTVYWTSTTGAHPVWGQIGYHWGQLGWENGLGYPVSDEFLNPDGVGYRQAFESDYSIYWSPATGPASIGGTLGARWGQFGYEGGELGYPLADQEDLGAGLMQGFQNGNLYFKSGSSPYWVHGEILNKFNQMGGIGNAGWPTGEEYEYFEGRAQNFEQKIIYWG